MLWSTARGLFRERVSKPWLGIHHRTEGVQYSLLHPALRDAFPHYTIIVSQTERHVLTTLLYALWVISYISTQRGWEVRVCACMGMCTFAVGTAALRLCPTPPSVHPTPHKPPSHTPSAPRGLKKVEGDGR